MKTTFIRQGNMAVPLVLEEFKIKDGEEFTAEVRKIRNPQFHRKFFKMIRVCFHNLPERYSIPTVEHLREELLLRAGYYHVHKTLKGFDMYIPDSISYESLDQDAFEELYNRVLDEICKILDISRADIESEIDNYS